jgi:hypothetical protein
LELMPINIFKIVSKGGNKANKISMVDDYQQG